jgi:putative endonuclease
MSKRVSINRQGEEIASGYLKRQGISILERNWRCDAGEADIIAREDESLVFIEVKTHAKIENGFPEDFFSPAKRSRYERIAMRYLMAANPPSARVRFDAISILYSEGKALLRHHRDAWATEA